MLTASSHIIELIKEFEGFSPSPYWDHKQWSWGYGTKAPGENGTITKEQATVELQNNLRSFENSIHTYVTNKGVKLSQSQFDALLSLVYNLGAGAIFTAQYNNGFARGSSLYNKLLKGDYKGAASHFGDFVKASGQVLPALVNRRAKEAALFLQNNGSKTITFLFIGGLIAFGIKSYYKNKTP